MFPKRGGKRKGAGRKPRGEKAGVPHRARPEIRKTSPVHVTLRVAEAVWNLRSRRAFRIVEEALYRGADQFGVRVVRFSVQGNHIHLIAEAPRKQALMQAMKGLSVRLARGLNRLMQRRGRVIGDRYHCRVLRTPTEVRHCIHYLRHNHRHHLASVGQRLPPSFIDPCSSDSPALRITLPPPSTWLLRVGWRRISEKQEIHPP